MPMTSTTSLLGDEMVKVVEEIDGLLFDIMKSERTFVDDPVNTVVGPAAVKHEKAFMKALRVVYEQYEEQVMDWIGANTVLKAEPKEQLNLFGLDDLNLSVEAFNTVLNEYMREGFRLAGQAAVDTISPGLGISFDLLNTRAIEWLDSYTLNLSQKTTARLTGNIKQELIDSFAKGESVPNGMKRIKEVFADAKDYELDRIVRTEHSRCMSAGSLEGYLQENVQYVTYLIAEDEWTCPICKAAAIENEKARADEVQGLLPQHPNCRCAWAPIVEDGVTE